MLRGVRSASLVAVVALVTALVFAPSVVPQLLHPSRDWTGVGRGDPGTITVVVTGQRLGKDALVEIRGLRGPAEGYRRSVQVRDRRVITGLSPGGYEVIAGDISGSGRTARPTIPRNTVTLTGEHGGRITITYRRDDQQPPRPGEMASAPGSSPPAPADSPGSAADMSRWEREVVTLTNEARSRARRCGEEGWFDAVEPVVGSNLLALAARGHSEDMARRQYFSHTSPDGSDAAERVRAVGYEWWAVGENIAAGYDTPEQVVQGWIDSPGHCANLMNPIFTELGVGYHRSDDDPSDYHDYWTQNFAVRLR